MTTDIDPKSADNDYDARRALWLAICDAAVKLAGCCRVYISRTTNFGAHINAKMPIPEVQTWKLVEALSLLAILIKADKVQSSEVTNLFGRTGPLHYIQDGRSWYIWGQPLLTGHESSLGGRPTFW